MLYGFVITDSGRALLDSVVAGSALTFTRAAVDLGTVESEEAARALTALIDPGPDATSTVPVVSDGAVKMTIEYRSDLNGGLSAPIWIGGFGLLGKAGDGEETLIGYGSLGEAKQYVSAYAAGVAPDARRFPVAIDVTPGAVVSLSYPADAFMTSQGVADLFETTFMETIIQKGTEDLTAGSSELATGTVYLVYE